MYTNAGKYQMAVTCPRCESKKVLFAAQLLEDERVVETLTGKEIPTDVYDPAQLLKTLVCESCISYFPAPVSKNPALPQVLGQIALESRKRYERRFANGTDKHQPPEG